MVTKLIRSFGHSATVTTWASMLIRIGGLALLLPLVLARLDVHEALVWQMLTTVTAMALWLDFGFAPTFSRLIAFRRGGGDIVGGRLATSLPNSHAPDLRTLIGTQRRIYVLLVAAATAMSGLLGTLALFAPISQLSQPVDGWIAWAITLVAAQFSLINSSNGSILTGMDRISDLRRTESLVSVLQLGTTCLVTTFTAHLVAIVACYSTWSVVLYLANRHHVLRLLKQEKIAVLTVDVTIFRAIWPSVWRSGIGILLSTGIIQGSALVVPQLMPAAQAASYLLALRLLSIVSQLSQAPFYSRLPAMAEAQGANRHHAVSDLATRGMKLAFWTFAMGSAGLLLLGPTALDLIDSSVALPNFSMLALMLSAFYAERYTAMHMQVYTLTNHVIWHLVNGATGALMILGGAALWRYIGIASLPTAMIVSYGFVGLFYMSRLSFKSLAIDRLTFERRTALYPALFLIALLLLVQITGQ